MNPKIVFEMFFLILSGTDVDFLDLKLGWRTYTTKEVFLTTKHIELVDKKKFTAIALDPEHETFVIHIVSLSFVMLPSFSPLDVHPFCKLQIAGLIAKEVFTKVSNKFIDFADVFSLDLASKLPKHTGINNHTIKLVNSQ